MASRVEIKDWTTESYKANKQWCDSLLENPEALQQIPSLNSGYIHECRHGQIVRFRGMIQDMYDPELYLEQYTVMNTSTKEYRMCDGKYMDGAIAEENEEIIMETIEEKLGERQIYVVISIPGLNDWAKEKRFTDQIPQSTRNSLTKREFENDEDENMPLSKKEKTETAREIAGPSDEQKTNVYSNSHLQNYPIAHADNKSCHVKTYDPKFKCKLNQVVDVVGFISLDPTLGKFVEDDVTMTECEFQAHNPPPHIVPRIHAIKIIERHSLSRFINVPSIISKAELIRSDLHKILSQLLFGDELAADFLICNLLSNVYVRQNEMAIGQFPLNITRFPLKNYPNFPKDFYKFLATLVTKSHYMELTLEYLNTSILTPRKDYDCYRVKASALQLSDHTHLVIDETVLTTGEVTEQGKKNYQALKDLINKQQMTYDFCYFTKDYETNIPVLVLSEASSFVHVAMQVPLKVDQQTVDVYPQVMEAARQYLKDEERLSNIRQYLRVFETQKFEHADDTRIVENDYVALRRKYPKFNSDRLHSLIVFSRLLALSRGQTKFTKECWKEAVDKEIERSQRIDRLQPS